jgi:hypothetical protein
MNLAVATASTPVVVITSTFSAGKVKITPWPAPQKVGFIFAETVKAAPPAAETFAALSTVSDAVLETTDRSPSPLLAPQLAVPAKLATIGTMPPATGAVRITLAIPLAFVTPIVAVDSPSSVKLIGSPERHALELEARVAVAVNAAPGRDPTFWTVKLVGNSEASAGGAGTLTWLTPLLALHDGVPAKEAEIVYSPGKLGARKVTFATPFEAVVANCS